MKIDPWECEYFECDDVCEIDEDGEEWWEWIYYCDNIDNKSRACNLDPRGGEQVCQFLTKNTKANM